MNITQALRRNNKYHKPIIVFKQLYRDYYKQSIPNNIQSSPNTTNNSNQSNSKNFNHNFSIFNSTLQNSIEQKTLRNQYNSFNNKQQSTNNKTLIKSKSYKNYNQAKYQTQQENIKKTNSVQKFTQYLLRMKQNKYSNESNCREGIHTERNYIESDEQKKQKIQCHRSKSTKFYTNHSQANNTFVFKLLQRSQLQELQKQKRSYFTNQYTQHHPFLQKNLNNFKLKSFNDKQNQMPKILPDIFKQNCTQKIKNPLERRIQLSELRTKIDQNKIINVQKFSKVRYNFLVKKHLQNQLDYNNKQNHKTKQNRNLKLQQTRQNIFPGSSQVPSVLG